MNDERKTPLWLFDRVNQEFHFTIDAAATPENALCLRFWTKADDGLKQNWSSERAWCNPPYSRLQLMRWVEKALSESAVTVLLVPGDSSTKASQRLLTEATGILFLDARIKFDSERSGAKFASWLVLCNGTERDLDHLAALELGIVYAATRGIHLKRAKAA
jgi:phage N-6-adenine-methyltransferase